MSVISYNLVLLVHVILYSTFLADSLVGGGDGLEFLFCRFLDVCTKGGYLVRMVFKCHLAVG